MHPRCNSMSKDPDMDMCLVALRIKVHVARVKRETERVVRDEGNENKPEPVVLGFLRLGKDFGFYSIFDRKSFQWL